MVGCRLLEQALGPWTILVGDSVSCLLGKGSAWEEVLCSTRHMSKAMC